MKFSGLELIHCFYVPQIDLVRAGQEFIKTAHSADELFQTHDHEL